MPCNELMERYEKEQDANGVLDLGIREPFYRAVYELYKEMGNLRFYKVQAIQMVDLREFVVRFTEPGLSRDFQSDPGYWRNSYFELDGELHDRAHKFIPKPKPDAPLTWEAMRMHFRPDAPRDLMDKPVKRTRPVWKRVNEGTEHESFIQVWEEVPEPEPEDEAEKAVKRFVRVVEVEVDTSPRIKEKIIKEEEINK